MDPTNKKITVFYPTPGSYDSDTSFRFVAYSHGFGGGGVQTAPAYWEVCEKLASFGYVVSLHHSCDLGCVSKRCQTR